MPFRSSKGQDPSVQNLVRTQGSSNLGETIGSGGGGVLPPGTITGGNVDGLEPGNGYVYNTWTGPGDAVVSGGDVKATIFMIGGGGGGGARIGGGGGAGGAVLYSCTLEPGTYPITVGAGGAGAPGENSTASNGSDTLFGPSTPVSLVAKGGGRGGQGNNGPTGSRAGAAGGCSGGSGTSPSGVTSGSENQTPQNPTFQLEHGFVQFGSDGGSSASDPGNSTDNAGGGGGTGGAGGVGRAKNNPSSNITVGTDAMHGGPGRIFQGFTGPLIGVPALAPLNGRFGGGGGGRASNGSPTTKLFGGGGEGGGGAAPGGNGTANSGGGGASPHPSGSGGSGIVIIKWENV